MSFHQFPFSCSRFNVVQASSQIALGHSVTLLAIDSLSLSAPQKNPQRLPISIPNAAQHQLIAIHSADDIKHQIGKLSVHDDLVVVGCYFVGCPAVMVKFTKN